MSDGTLAQFIQTIGADPALKAQLGATRSWDEFTQLAAKLGRERGLSFTADELSAAMAAMTPAAGELTDAELEQAAGGLCGDTTTRPTNARACGRTFNCAQSEIICPTDACP